MENVNETTENKTPESIEQKKFLPKSFIFLIVLPLLLIGAFYFLQGKIKKQITQTPIAVNTPTPTPPILKTYTNEKYGFEFTYPAKGIILIDDEEVEGPKVLNEVEGQCGNAIKENLGSILIDNFYEIKILDWKRTIDDYIVQKNAKKTYDFEPINNSNADEAVKVLGIKKGMELVSVGYPPLMYIEDIYKKDNKLFIFVHSSHPPKPTNPNGCLNPEDINPIKYKKYVDQNWRIETSFKFLNQQSSAETSTWKTYRNEQYKFEVKYPSGWKIRNGDGSTIVRFYPPEANIDIINGKDDKAAMNELYKWVGSTYSITIGSRSFSDSTENLSKAGPEFIIDRKIVTVDGVMGNYYKTHQCAPTCETLVDLPFENGTKTLSITMDQEANENIFNELLSSFKFLD